MQREYHSTAGILMVQIRKLRLVSFRFDWLLLPTFLVLDGLVPAGVAHLLAAKTALRRAKESPADDRKLEW